MHRFSRVVLALPRATYPTERSEKSVETRVSSTDGGAVRPRGADVFTNARLEIAP